MSYESQDVQVAFIGYGIDASVADVQSLTIVPNPANKKIHQRAIVNTVKRMMEHDSVHVTVVFGKDNQTMFMKSPYSNDVAGCVKLGIKASMDNSLGNDIEVIVGELIEMETGDCDE